MELLAVTESKKGEARVAISPETVRDMKKLGLTVSVESQAGERASLLDAMYKSSGAEIKQAGAASISQADILVSVNPPQRHLSGRHQFDILKSNSVWISPFWPQEHSDALKKARKNRLTVFSLNMIPRISRAQKMDVLSSQSNLAGYYSVILAAAKLPKIFPLMMTAAGTINPARVVVIGAGVAGLQAVATAKRLGAIVEVSDIRPEVKEQVESLGGRFIDVVDKKGSSEGGYAKEGSEEFKRAQAQELKSRVSKADVVICTALIPGRPAPKIITKEMVKEMASGSVIIDLAAQNGGNCELTKQDRTVDAGGVRIIGETNILSYVAKDASRMFSSNLQSFLSLIIKDKKLNINLEDEIVAGTLLLKDGEPFHKLAKEILGKGGEE